MLLSKKPRTAPLRLTLALPFDLKQDLDRLRELAGTDGLELDIQGAVVRYLRRAVSKALKDVEPKARSRGKSSRASEGMTGPDSSIPGSLSQGDLALATPPKR